MQFHGVHSCSICRTESTFQPTRHHYARTIRTLSRSDHVRELCNKHASSRLRTVWNKISVLENCNHRCTLYSVQQSEHYSICASKFLTGKASEIPVENALGALTTISIVRQSNQRRWTSQQLLWVISVMHWRGVLWVARWVLRTF